MFMRVDVCVLDNIRTDDGKQNFATVTIIHTVYIVTY